MFSNTALLVLYSIVVWNGIFSTAARTGSVPGTGTRSGRRERQERGDVDTETLCTLLSIRYPTYLGLETDDPLGHVT